MEYWYDVSAWTEETTAPDVTQLPPSWQARITKHKRLDKAKEAAFAYCLLAKLVEQQVGCLPAIGMEAQGKPDFVDQPTLHFSISHTKGCAMVAVATVPIGVDVERIRPVSAHLMERVGQTNDVDDFFQTWVNREAQGKCLGLGITATGQVPGDTQAITMVPTQAPVGYKTALAMLV